MLSGAQAGPVEKAAAEIEDRTIPVGPTGSTCIRMLRPPGSTERLPVAMYFHGAGWVMGDVNTHDRPLTPVDYFRHQPPAPRSPLPPTTPASLL